MRHKEEAFLHQLRWFLNHKYLQYMENVISIPDTLTTAHSVVKDTWLSGNKNSLNFLLIYDFA